MPRFVRLAQPQKPTLAIIMENPLLTQIEQYLDGAMPPELRREFEARLAADPALAAELRLHQAARAAVQVQAVLDRRESLYQRGRQKLLWRSWWWKIQDAFVQISPDGGSKIRWGLVAGTGLAILFLVYLALKPVLSPDAPAVPKPLAVPKEKVEIAYNTYFKHYDLSNSLGGADTDTLYTLARQQYAARNCMEALRYLNAVLADKAFEYRPMALLLRGTCLLDSEDTDAAIATFREIPAAAAGPFQEAQWYTALAYLKAGDAEKASALLREIAENPSHRRRSDASALLEFAGGNGSR